MPMLNNILDYIKCQCLSWKVYVTQSVTVNLHNLPLFYASMLLSFALSVDDIFTLTFHCGGPHSTVELAVPLNG